MSDDLGLRHHPLYRPKYQRGDLVQYHERVKEVGQVKPKDGEMGFVLNKFAQAFWEIRWLSGLITAEYDGNIKLIKRLSPGSEEE
jgi:hypothetical protein|tara:strand:+ start:4862 stop:5116 length:255 start_codon:yes stop_codon:yes gene_type:complete